jgi:hypothetical protein
METQLEFRLRVETCIGTIIDVHKSVSDACETENILSQFEKLRKAVNQMDMSQVSEQDVLLVEEATNALLSEFRNMFIAGACSLIYESPQH